MKKKEEPPKGKITSLFMKRQSTKVISDVRDSEENSIQSPAIVRSTPEPSPRVNTFNITNNITMLKQQQDGGEPNNQR